MFNNDASEQKITKIGQNVNNCGFFIDPLYISNDLCISIAQKYYNIDFFTLSNLKILNFYFCFINFSFMFILLELYCHICFRELNLVGL